MKTLDLTIDSYSLSLQTFTDRGYERTLADTGQTEYTIWGTAADDGPVFEAKHIWNISVVLSKAQWYLLGAIFKHSDAKRRILGDYSILVADRIEEFIEDGTRSRAIASGTTETAITGGATAYYASFKARMFEPKSQWIGNPNKPYIATFTLRELDKVLA